MEADKMMMVQNNSPIAKLVRLQKEVGYEEGKLNIVALLGFFGEAGEVLAEVSFDKSPKLTAVDQAFLETIKEAIKVAAKIDAWKKAIRDKEYMPNVTMTVEEDFKKELADQTYYAHALAMGQNTSMNELAVISINKVLSKKLKKQIGHANQ